MVLLCFLQESAVFFSFQKKKESAVFFCWNLTLSSSSISFAQGEPTVEITPERTTQTKHSGNIAYKYSSVRDQSSSLKPAEQVQKGISSASSINLEAGSPEEPPAASTEPESPPAETASRWASMKMGLQNFRASMGSKKFFRLSPSTSLGTNASATESLDEIFRKLKRNSSSADADHLDDDDGLP